MHGITLSHFTDRYHQTGFDSAHMQGAVWVHGSTAGAHHMRPSDLGRTARKKNCSLQVHSPQLQGSCLVPNVHSGQPTSPASTAAYFKALLQFRGC